MVSLQQNPTLKDKRVLKKKIKKTRLALCAGRGALAAVAVALLVAGVLPSAGVLLLAGAGCSWRPWRLPPAVGAFLLSINKVAVP